MQTKEKETAKKQELTDDEVQQVNGGNGNVGGIVGSKNHSSQEDVRGLAGY